jgi:hypothetical protein
MAKDDDKQEREPWEDWPKNDWRTEASDRAWLAWVDAKNAVKDWLAR